MPTVYQAQLRHAAHFVNVVNSANTLYSEVNGSRKDALMWLKSELLNIKNGQRWAAQNLEDENAGLLCLLYPLLGREFPSEFVH